MPLTAGRSVYTTRPTHCVRGCGHPLAAGDIRNHHYVCSRCREYIMLGLAPPKPEERVTN